MTNEAEPGVQRQEPVHPLPYARAVDVHVFPGERREERRKPQPEAKPAVQPDPLQAVPEKLANARKLALFLGGQEQQGQDPPQADEALPVQFSPFETGQIRLELFIVILDREGFLRFHLPVGRGDHAHLEPPDPAFILGLDQFGLVRLDDHVFVQHGSLQGCSVSESVVSNFISTGTVSRSPERCPALALSHGDLVLKGPSFPRKRESRKKYTF